ncbi:sn-glycerol-1-phosphate dehydrogenase [Olsenella sp. HMSC062G07]|uniref:sn-glycerol-1-phosphate dehydrogenase n=1 Tax=Olsenella sp. HMSC062G07 TaxID=1739330 RepID=UPI0008A1EF91|nr:sn-glycerol-1-phosphate dehydrogenase [Olsenella sp. HMSC062G07]OFK22418.1 alcohol dehydrogenase [Olsenella sp. HMSC062G07]
MKIDSTKLSGQCECGTNHVMTTQAALIDSGLMSNFDSIMDEFTISGTRGTIYDENTYDASNLTRPKSQVDVILNPTGLHADEHATEEVLEKLSGHQVDYLVAIGSGTIHDTTRYCAHKLNIPFVACPTAASVDGFCSTVSAMTWQGVKTTMPGIAPRLVIADTSVINAAPLRLSLSGIGDIIGKFTALADWKITHLVNGEHFCKRINDLTMNAINTVFECCNRVPKGDEAATANLIYALLLSGLAMQLMGNSRPASGSEHHISHTIEMEPPSIRIHSSGLHGEKVGVGTILISEYYHRLAKIEDISSHVIPYRRFSEEELRGFWGNELYEGIAQENSVDEIEMVSPEMLVSAWPAIRGVVQDIPTADSLRSLYSSIGMKQTLESIDIPSSHAKNLISFSPSARRRATFNRISRMIEL